MTSTAGSCLEPTYFLDPDHPSVRDFTHEVIASAASRRERVTMLFAAVRDRIWYDPYSVSRAPEHYRASDVLKAERAYCVPKAVLLTAVLRAAGLPARVGFADVRNHLQADTLRALMGDSDLFVYHGYSSVYFDGRWCKATPAFNVELCDRFGVPPVEFDGWSDALMHAFTANGTRHMEYVRDHGTFEDLPLDRILAALDQAYGPMVTAALGPDDDFSRPKRRRPQHAPSIQEETRMVVGAVGAVTVAGLSAAVEGPSADAAPLSATISELVLDGLATPASRDQRRGEPL